MQFITRVLIVIAVLAGLGYGSYAFGKYVLSARLFGPQNGKTSTTASVGSEPLKTPSNVEVEVVPAPQPTDKSDVIVVPPVAAQPSATPNERVEATPSQNDNSGSTRDSTDNNPEPTRKPRRRRRRARPTSRPEPRPKSATQVEAPPTRTQNVEPPANSGSDNGSSDNSSAETPRQSDPVPVPTRRRRERRTDVAPAPNVETPRAEAPRIRPERRPERRRDSSPVPVPEGALGGGASSPVPVPG